MEEAIRDVTAAFLGREENPKAPWRMTRDEYLAHDRLLGYWGREIEELADRVRSHDHRVHVERALKAGKFVPPEVLADYPELRDLRAGNPGVVKRRAGGATPKPVKRSDWPIGKALDEAYKAGCTTATPARLGTGLRRPGWPDAARCYMPGWSGSSGGRWRGSPSER